MNGCTLVQASTRGQVSQACYVRLRVLRVHALGTALCSGRFEGPPASILSGRTRMDEIGWGDGYIRSWQACNRRFLDQEGMQVFRVISDMDEHTF